MEDLNKKAIELGCQGMHKVPGKLEKKSFDEYRRVTNQPSLNLHKGYTLSHRERKVGKEKDECYLCIGDVSGVEFCENPARIEQARIEQGGEKSKVNGLSGLYNRIGKLERIKEEI